MNICIPKERMSFEYRVGLTPAGIQLLSNQGHQCFIEHDAGIEAGFSDQDYEIAGGRILYSSHEVFARADLLLKVSRPLREEVEWMPHGAALAGLLHMAAARQDLIETLLKNNITAIAYEQIQNADGKHPVLKPLSQIGGRLAAQIGARLLQNNSGGKGVLLGGIAGVPPAEVAIIGAGVVGLNAASTFASMGAHVTVLDTDLNALQRIIDQTCQVVTMISNPINIARVCTFADVVVGAILTPGDHLPIVVTREMVRSMKPRSVIMDISIDEGGCIETSRPTTHEKSTYVEEGVIHYCVPNIPSLVARTATYAFLNAALPFILDITDRGIEAAIHTNPALSLATYSHAGELRHIIQHSSS
jgi:alanine dehydrogenase